MSAWRRKAMACFPDLARGFGTAEPVKEERFGGEGDWPGWPLICATARSVRSAPGEAPGVGVGGLEMAGDGLSLGVWFWGS